MKHLKKIISFLTVICCLAGSLMPLQAAEADDVPRIVFTNEPRMEANLYVTKTVESGRDGQSIPDSEMEREFTFTLKLGGSQAQNAASNVTYHKFGADGEEILVPLVGSGGPVTDSSGNQKMTYPKTSAYGRFTLKSGERAEFRSADIPELKAGTYYEVTEEETRNYQEIEQGGKAQGYLPENGITVPFRNQYTNPQAAGLEVQKTISGVQVGQTEYEIPDFLMPEQGFKFRLMLEQKNASNEPFQLISLKTGKSAEGATDENGIFYLPGNYKAVFTGENIHENMDYEVQELVSDGNGGEFWRPVGDTGLEDYESQTDEEGTVIARQEGTTSANPVAYFRNALGAFGVSKKMEDGSLPEAEFTFELTDADYGIKKNVPYLVYEIISGDLVTDQGCGTTGNDGRFTLRPGQMAVFLGMGTGDRYNVYEVKTGETEDTAVRNEGNEKREQYIQVLPEDPDGYTNKVVTDYFEVLPFENKPMDGGLAVTKAVVNESDDAAFDRNVEFSFTLSKITPGTADGEPEKAEPQKNAYYIVERGGRQFTYQTDKDGKFTLKANETALFTRLLSGTYRVTEDVTGMVEYSVLPEEDRAGSTQTTISHETIYVKGENASLTFTNYYVPHKVNLLLKKVDADGTPLAGAQFELYRDEEETNPVTYLLTTDDSLLTADDILPSGEDEGEAGNGQDENSMKQNEVEAVRQNAGNQEKKVVWSQTYTTPENGIIEIQDLKAGTYYLRETKAPSGYILLPDAIKIQIVWKDTDGNETEAGKGTLEVVIDDGKYDKDVVGQIQVNKEQENRVEITVINSELYELPNSGGMGIYWYTVGGMLLMMAAALILYRNKKAGEVLRD